MDDAQFPVRFTAANRTGFYLRVLEEGRIAAGDTIECVGKAKDSISVRDAFRLRHGSGGTRAEYQHAARVRALTPSWRAAFEQRLAGTP